MSIALSTAIKRLRAKKGYTQEQLASICNVSRQAVAKWESGVNSPDIDKIVQLAEIFDMSIDELITGKTPEPRIDFPKLPDMSYLENERIVNQALKNSLAYDIPDDSINSFISYIGAQVGCERVYIFEPNGEEYYQNTYEWCGKGVIPQKEFLENIPTEEISVWINVLSSGEYIYIENVDAIAETDPVVYRWLKPQGIDSLLAFPLFGGRSILGVDNPAPAFVNHTLSLLEIMVHFLEILLHQRDLYRELNINILQNKQITELSRGVQYRLNLISGDFYVDKNQLKYSGYDDIFTTVSQFKEYMKHHPEFSERIMEGIHHVIDNKKNAYIEFLSYRKDRRIRWNRLSISPFIDSGGNVLQLYGVIQDCSNKHQIIEKYNNYFSHLSGGLHICYLSNPVHLEYASDELCEFLGYTREEFELEAGVRYTNLIAEEDRDTFRSFVKRLAAAPGIESCEYRLIRKDGSHVTVVDNMESIENGRGIMYGYAFIFEKTELQALLDLANEREKQQLEVISSQYDVIMALGKDYSRIFRVWPEEERAQIVSIVGICESGVVSEDAEYFNYRNFCKNYINDRVCPEDREKMEKAMNIDTILNAFSENTEYSVIYRVCDEDKLRFYQLKCIKLDKPDSERETCFVAAFKNVDKVIQEEHQQKEELKNRLNIINAIVQSYTCSYYIDYKNDFFTELSCNNEGIGSVIGKEGCLSESLMRWRTCFNDKAAAAVICDFVNGETLVERMNAQQHLTSQVEVEHFGWYELNILVVDYDEDNNLSHCIFAASDITESKQREKQWLHSLGIASSRERAAMRYAYVDTLTGVLNRNAFERDFSKIDELSQVGFLYCDVNNLKKINDIHGHTHGDVLLTEFSTLLKKHFSVDCIYRTGGDEFICMIANISEDRFKARAEEFIEIVAKYGDIASVGYDYGKPSHKDDLLRSAEEKMYKMKQCCKDRIANQIKDTLY